MTRALASLFGYVMNFICGIVSNYGLAIILFTIFVKLLLLPLTIKQQKSLQQSQKMQPLMQELQKKYGNDQQKLAEEYQKLLKENNMSMVGSTGCAGCVISLIQLPILFSLFYMMQSPLTHIMKMDADKIQEYKNQLIEERKTAAIVQIESQSGEYSAEEYQNYIENAEKASYVHPTYYEIEIIKENNLMDLNFLGINLGDVASNNKGNYALLIIPITSGLLTYLSVAITNWINKKKGIVQQKPEDSEIPMPDMRVMNLAMPIMLGYLAYSIPQGVGLYWTINNYIGVIQTIVMNRNVFTKNEKLLDAPVVEKKK